jgi:hypothetical protein
MALISAWLALLIYWQDIRWFGRTIALERRLPAFESVAERLRKDWPREDGVRPELGAFMAYPRGKPQTLLIVAHPRIPTGLTSFRAVERSNLGALRFQLTDVEDGIWLEWHPDTSTPDSFVGGLDDAHQLVRFQPMGLGWFVTSYIAGGK